MIKPLHKFVVLQKEAKETTTTSGIILTTESKSVPGIAKIIALGPDCTTDIKESDQVVYKEYSGTKVEIDSNEFIVIDEEDILAVID